MTRIIASADAEAYAKKLLPPVSKGLIALHLLNDSAEKVARNYAIGQVDGSLSGEPEIGSSFIGCKGLSDYVQTRVVEPLEGTFFIAARKSSDVDIGTTPATQPMIFGTFKNQAVSRPVETFGISMVMTSASTITAYASRGDNSDQNTSAGTSLTADLTEWSAYCMTVTDTDGTTLRNLTNPASNKNTSTLPRLRTIGSFRIGSGYSEYSGACDVAFWSAYDRVLSDDEINEQYAWIRSYLARREIVL